MRMPMLTILALALPLTSGTIWAAEGVARTAGADTVVARNAKGLAVTATDLELEAERYSPDAVRSALARPDGVRQIARNLLLRRALATDAERQQLDRQPTIASRLRIAREKVLSDARVQQFDGTAPDLATLEKLARAEYNAYPDRYRIAAGDRLEIILIGRYRKDSRQLAEELLAQARSGEDFGSLAVMYSDDPATKGKRGDLGFFEKNNLHPELARAAAGLVKPGDVSEIVETPSGWNILRLAEKRPAGRKSFEEVKDELMQAAARGIVDKRRSAGAEAFEEGLEFDEKAVEAIVARHR